ncbi:NAD(P)-binding protein [Mycena olivaceomarginata]|nr:NAD(P)-binding protein [Mycena olivaceomarginata]
MGNTIPFSLRHMAPSNTYTIVRQSFFCGNSKWNTDDVPDLSGQVIIVTGGNAGIGGQTMKLRAVVYMASRNQRKAEATIEELYELTGKRAVFLDLDPSDLPSTKLHILYNNAGIMMPRIELVTSEGYDITFETNVLDTGTLYLTKLLLPALLSAAASNRPGCPPAQQPNLTPVIHYIAIDATYNSFKDGPARRKMHPANLYSNFGQALHQKGRRLNGKAINWPQHATLTLTNFHYVAPWGRICGPMADVDEPHSGTELWTSLEEQIFVG